MASGMIVYVVGIEPLDSGPDGSADPEAGFSTRDAAVAWGREHGVSQLGSHWWGETNDIDSTYAVWEIEVDAEHCATAA